MGLEAKLTDALKTAMRNKDKMQLTALRAIKSAILLEKTAEGSDGTLDEDKEVKLLSKLVKQRQDSLQIYKEQNRADLAEKEQAEIAVIQQFLPQQLTAAELKTAIAGIIAETNASSMKDMGKVMGLANKQIAGKAAGKDIANEVKAQLNT